PVGRSAHLKPAPLAARLHRALHAARSVARRPPARPVPRYPRLPAARAALRQSHRLMARTLLVRVAFAVPAIALAVAVLWLCGWVLATALAVLGVLGTREIYDLARREGIEPFENLGLPAAAAAPLATFWEIGRAHV